ncbi:DUF3802 family protein [Shewanella maritima]|uniref:DUF3802 family protein n=1 Tax=Shewanella maritima TaxID=2520507 RepID=UPI0037354D5A
MVTDKDGYIHLIQYLTEHLGLFETPEASDQSAGSVMALFETQLSEQIMSVCSQNPQLSFAQRNMVIREIDAIVYDLEEILGSIGNHQATSQQYVFITEFSGLIKNLFDQEVDKLLN